MKKPFDAFNPARGFPRGVLLMTFLSQAFPFYLGATETMAPPALEFASGLPGKQVRLTWPAQSGLRYRIEKSTSLGAWSQIAVVDASATEAVWLDPEPTTQKAFYRVMQPQPEVFSISFPLLTTVGGELRLHGQCIPPGSFLVLDVDGVAQTPAPLEESPDESGIWSAMIGGALPGGAVISARIVNAAGVTLVSIDQPITVTASGRATDSPPSLPPAAPVGVVSKPVPGIGIIVKQGGSGAARMAPGPDEDCDDADPFLPLGVAIKTKGTGAANNFADDQSSALIAAWLGRKGYQYYQAQSSMNSAACLSKKGYDYYQMQSSMNSAACLSKKGYDYYLAQSSLNSAACLGKKGYDYYKSASDNAASALHNNPAFQSNNTQGQMPSTQGDSLVREIEFSRLKHPELLNLEMGPGAISPAPSGLPGEVSFRSCDLSLPCPAGPPLAWVCTYRSMVPVSSGHGPGWDFSYNIRIEAASSTAPQVTVHDGGGRSDIFYRQADGGYRCDGMFREGRFTGDTFTLTFADKGTWTFKPLGTSYDAGKISAITDRNGIGLACAYDRDGQLATVSDTFGRRLTVVWGNSPPRILSVTASAGVTLNFSKIEFTYTPQGGKRESVSAPFVPGQTPVAGPTTYAYASSSTDPRLDDNLLSITDGGNRLLEAFAYSSTTSPTEIDYDTCASHDRASHGGALYLTSMHYESLSSGGYQMIENDELGRVTVTTLDRMHRVVALREYTGFWNPGAAVTSAELSKPVQPRLHLSDPAYFETTCAYNADSLCTRITHPDGSRELVTYDRDFRQNCPVRERANPRVITLTTPGPIVESRTVTRDYQSGFGTPELFLPGNPIKGMTVKGGRNPGGDIVHSIEARGRRATTFISPRNQSSRGGLSFRGVTGHDSVGLCMKEEGGRHTPFHNKYRPQNAAVAGGIAGGVVAGIVVGKEECDDGRADDDCDGFVTRMVNAHGQVSTCGYDTNGNRTSYISALPNRGRLYQYDGSGRRTGSTVLNGPGSSFSTAFNYGANGFLSSVIEDSSGLHITTVFGRDAQGRVTSVTDPRGGEWLYAYNPLDQCIQIQSPPMPSGTGGTPPYRITTDLTIDNGGRIVRCDTTHFRSDGSADPANPAYSTYFLRDERARLIQVAREQRPIAAQINFSPASFRNENFDVCDISRDNAGQVVRLSTPAVCRGQATDRVCDFTYNERGMPDRCIDGGLGTAGAVTTEYAYDSVGAMVRCTTLDSADSPQTLFTYDGFHRPSSITDPMGNVTEYAYGNDGSVTASVFGEIDDVPGLVGNVLLGRKTVKSELVKHLGLVNLVAPSASSAFFSVETKDDTITEERFIPGSTAPHAAEVTVVVRSPAGLVQSVTCNGDLLMSCEYDTAGRRIRCADGSCSALATLDACGDVISMVRTDISGVNGVDSKAFTTICVRDPLGRMTSCTDGSGNVTSIAYDSLGRPVSITAPGRPSVLYAYDGAAEAAPGLMGPPYSVQVSCDISSTGSPVVLSSCLVGAGECRRTTDANGFSEVFIRDALGRTTRCDHPDGTYEEYAYDSLGRNNQWRCQDGAVRATWFDLNGRPSLVSWSASALAPPSHTTVCSYDGFGVVSCLTRSLASGDSSVFTFTHDSVGNTVSENQAGQIITRTFNHRGRTGITYPDGRQFNESRDALGRLLSVTNSTGGNVVTMGYAGHRAVRSTQGNGVVTTWDYRGDGDAGPPVGEDFSFDECVRSTVSSPSSVILSDERVFRDRSQQVTRCETSFAAGTNPPYRSKAVTLDGLGRVTGCVTERRDTTGGPVVSESSVSYVLGKEGRRISEIRNTVPGDYTQSDSPTPADFQMGQYTTWPGGSLTWDDAGNLHNFNKGTLSQEFVHDAEGRLVAVNDSTTGSPLLELSYDPLGRVMIHKIHRGQNLQSVRFVYDGDVCIQELGTDNLADMTFVCADGIKQCISTRNGTIYYPHGGGSPSACGIIVGHEECDDNNLDADDGCTSLITSATGAPLERFDCDDAGKPIFLTSDGLPSSAASSSIGLRWLSPACAWEPEIGVFTCPGGVYSPDLGSTVSSQKIPARSVQKELMNES